MTSEDRIRSKVASLKQAQMQRMSEGALASEILRKNYEMSVGGNGEAFKTRSGGFELDEQGRAMHLPREYMYSDEQLQRAMDVRNSDNRIGNLIFDFIQRQTGSPTMASNAVSTAGFTPGVGTAMGLEDAYQAAKDIPDGYREGDYRDMAGNAASVALGLGDAALTALPFAKTAVRGARALPDVVRSAGKAASDGMFAIEDFMAPRPIPRETPTFAELEAYLRQRGK